jgi:hypothetical protein
MAVNPIAGTVAKYGGIVSTVDPTTGTLQVILKTADTTSVSVYVTGPVWRWPQVGDNVMVRQENGSWYFDGWFINANYYTTLNDLDPGDAAIVSPTGVIRIIGSTDGSTDFTLKANTSWITATLANGWIVNHNAPQYMIDVAGFVHIRGSMSGGATNSTAFVLPADYRPGISDFYICLGANGYAGNYVHINTGGVVSVTTANSEILFGGGVTFLAEN